MTQTEIIGKSEPSRLFNQQRSKVPPIIDRAIAAGYAPEIVPVAPPGATISPNSTLGSSCVGKIPMLFDECRRCWYGYPWTRHNSTIEELECCAINRGSFGFKGSVLPGLDCDVENEEQVKQIIQMIHRLGWRGTVRYRKSSSRILMVLTCKPDFVPTYRYVKWREPNGAEHTVEVMGRGKFYVVHGIHPNSGDEYRWVRDLDPFAFGLDNHTKIDKAMFDQFFSELADTIETYGWGEIVKRGGGSGRPGERKALDDTRLHAPSPQHVLDLLKVWQNTPENVPTHSDFVAITAAIKSALGPDREDYYPEFLEWALEYPGNDEAYVRGRWDSIT